MEKYCFGGETEAVVTSYHTSLPGVREARLETSETPLPLSATTLQSVLQPFSLKKSDNKTNSESAVEILKRSYPYKLNPNTGQEERKRTIPYKINDDSDVTENMKNDEAKENSSERKTRKSEGQLLAIPYKMKKTKDQGENKEKETVTRKEEERKKEEVERKEVEEKEARCYHAGGLRVEREAAQQVPKEIRRKEAPVEMCGAGGRPVRIRQREHQREQPAKIFVGGESSRQREEREKNSKHK